MKRTLLLIIGLFLLSSLSWVLADNHPSDNPGTKDPAYFNRMPGYFIYDFQENDFNQYEFPSAKNKTTRIEGHYFHVAYQMPYGEKCASPIAIFRNYENAVKSMGGQVVYRPTEWELILKGVKDNSEIWVDIKIISGDGSAYEVYTVGKESMTQEIVMNADSMAKNLKDMGKVVIYGIYFDTGRSEIKPASEPILQEAAKLLKTNPAMKLLVVGHTDNIGSFEANLKLSRDRADAVVKNLIGKYGIVPARLAAWGDGPAAPVASNRTEEGKALNRRVELVEIN